MKKIVQITGVIYFSGNYGIYSAKDESYNVFTVKGTTTNMLAEGRIYDVKGEISVDAKYNKKTLVLDSALEADYRQLNLPSYQLLPMKSLFFSMEEHRYYENYRKFPTNNEVIEELEDRLLYVEMIKDFMDKYSMTFKDAESIIYNDDDTLKDRILENPYLLMEYLSNFTFTKCDKIASKIGYNPYSNFRIRQAIRNVIKNYCYKTGDSYCTITKKLKEEITDNLNYYLSAKEADEILSKNKKEESVNYTSFNYTNMIYLKELRETKEKGEKYLFFTIWPELIEEELNNSDEVFLIEDDKYYLSELRKAEITVKNSINCIIADESTLNDKNLIKNFISDYEKEKSLLLNLDFKLNDKQKEAVLNIISFNDGGFYILNGGAGTGKTTVVECILYIYNKINKKNKKVEVLAPTGMATNVLRDNMSYRFCSNIYPKTIHNFIGVNGFTKGKPLQLIYDNLDFVIIDETSMLDLELIYKFLKSVNIKNLKLLFLGDSNQLPSIGPGRVLKDLVELYPDKCFTLTETCRQSKGSGIIDNAINILEEKDIVSVKPDNYVIYSSTQKFKTYLDYSIDYLSQKCGYSLENTQILVPKKNGEFGTKLLNTYLQKKYNPMGEQNTRRILNEPVYEKNLDKNAFNNQFFIGDKVVNIKNDYNIVKLSNEITEYSINNYYNTCIVSNKNNKIKQIGIANGDIGYIHNIFKTFVDEYDNKGKYIGCTKKNIIIVKYKEGFAAYDPNKICNLRLAYAITIHKSQGSTYDGCITIIDDNYMANNELFYVSNTRAKNKNILITKKSIYDECVHKHLSDRNSTLK